MKSIRVIVLIIFSIFTTSILARSCQTQQSGNWSDQSTWSNCGGLIPQNDDSVLIKTNHTLLLNQDTSNISGLSVDAGGRLNVASPGFTLKANSSGDDIDLTNASIDLAGNFSINAQSHNILLGEVDGNFNLTLNSQLEIRLIGTIGGNTALSKLKTNPASTTVFANTNGSSFNATIIVEGDRIFKGPVLLAKYTNIQGNGGVITFDSTLDSETSTADTLLITSASNVDISFNGKIGSTNRLKYFTISDVANSTTFINTSEILTNNDQSWQTNIVLDSPTDQLLMNIAVSGAVQIGSSGATHTLRSLTANEETLTIESAGNVTIYSTVGDNNQSLYDMTISSPNKIYLYNDITVDYYQEYMGPVQLYNDLKLTGDYLDFGGTVKNRGFNLTLNPTVSINNLGRFFGSGDIIKEGAGSFKVTLNSSVTGAIYINQGSITNLTTSENAFANASGFYLGNGTSSSLGQSTTDIFTLGNGQILAGTGDCDCILQTQSGSVVSPGFSPGQLSTNTINMNTGSTLNIELNGSIAGTDYDQLVVDTVDFDTGLSDGASLNISMGFTPNANDTFTLVKVNGPDPIQGTFIDLPEGSLFVINELIYSISYLGGDGNDVVLTVLGKKIIFVNKNATANGDGQSWNSAFDNLQDAFIEAVVASGMEIWVAQGVYYPDVGGSQIDNDRLATFTLIDGVSVYGGFNGSETLRTQRNSDTNVTILSGDINQDDLNIDNNFIAENTTDIIGDNSFHIVDGSGVAFDTILDGFTITAGFANGGTNTKKRGAGISCGANVGGPSLNQMTFIANISDQYGAASYGCSQNVTNSYFKSNSSSSSAGALYAYGGNLDHVVFENNHAAFIGGAVVNFGNPITIINSKFIANEAELNFGGGLYTKNSTLLENVLFKGNYARYGGGLYIINTEGFLSNVTMTGNRADIIGGAISNWKSDITINNSIIWNNQDDSGVGTADSSMAIESPADIVNNYSLIQGFGTAGIGNLDEDPLFIAGTDPSIAPTTLGNAHLNINSPAINTGDNNAISQAVDLDGNTRILDTNVDMGAYEFSSNTVTVTVSGLGEGFVVLQNNGGDDLNFSNNGTQVFSSSVAYSADYLVSVLTQPTSPSQLCVVSNASGTINGSDILDVNVECIAIQYNVGVDVSGLASGNFLSLENNGEELMVSSNGMFNFATALDDLSIYNVLITTQPTSPNQDCLITSNNASGNLSGADEIIIIECTTIQYNVGVDVSGLANGNSVIFDNIGESLTVTIDGQFNFATALDDGSAYDVTITTQPQMPNQMCSVVSGAGSLSEADVLLTVTCTTNQYFVGGMATGLASGNSVTLSLGSEDLNVNNNAAFVFMNPLTDESQYTVSVLNQPMVPNQTCGLVNPTGTIAGNDITDMEVNCVTNKYRIGGTVTGLYSGNNLVLQNNGADDLIIVNSGDFDFSTAIDDLQGYNVNIFNQASNPIQSCIISNNVGNVAGSSITSVSIACEFGDDLIYKGGFE